MKITGVKTTLYSRPSHPLAGTRQGNGCLVELSTNEGLVGLGIGSAAAATDVALLVAQILRGEDPRAATGLWQRMVEAFYPDPEDVLSRQSLAMLDMALWDLKAKANGEPLWKTLGGARPRANAHVDGAQAPRGDDDLFQWCSAMARDHGLRGGKLKVAQDPDADLRRLDLMHRAFSQITAEPVLVVDADEGWSPKEAIRRVRDMEEKFDLAWVEAPAGRRDFLGLKRVSNAIRSAVCAGKGLPALEEFLPFFHHHALDIIQIDVGALGITAALQLADAAYGFELPVTLCATPGNVQAHLAGAMPYFMSVEVMDPRAAQGFISSDVRIEEGWAVAGDSPGLGLVIDQDALSLAAAEFARAGTETGAWGERP
ncbi:MAG: hypothetical protein HYY36_04110 [Gammaproteobacteria bacterium]|nr:hypothetical protein [Gammaproteobacteria bacterium]